MLNGSDKTVKVELKAEVNGYRRDMQAAGRATREFGRDARAGLGGAATQTEALGRSAGGASSGVKTLAKAAAGLVAFDAAAQFIGSSVTAASDLQQTVLKSDVIFGNNSREMQAWAKSAEEAAGLSQEAALGAAAGFGDMFSQIGFTGDAAATMSKDVVQLAADLGSFNNLDTAEVLDMISASFRGEYDSLQRVIPNINAARVETEALAETGKKSAKELTAQEKATATLAIITKDGARAQGDFARSAGTLAIEQQKLNAKFENAKAALGEQLMPVFSAAVDVMSDAVSVMTAVGQAFAEIPGPVKAAVVALTAFHLLKGPVGSALTAMRLQMQRFREEVALQQALAGGIRGGYRRLGDEAQAAGQRIGRGAAAAAVATNGLRTAGAGLMGLLGGPWGLALTGATVLLGSFVQSQMEADAAAKALTDTMDKQSGKFTEASRNSIRDALMGDLSGKDQELLQGLGVSFTDLSDAIIAGGPELVAYKEKLQQIQWTNPEAAAAVRGLEDSVRRQSAAATEARAAGEALARENKNTGDSADGAQDGVEGLADTTKILKDASDAAAAKQKELADAILETSDAAISADEANANLAESISEAYEVQKEFTGGVNKERTELVLSTEAGRKKSAALRDLAKDAKDAAEANLENGASAKEVTASMKDAREEFVKVAHKMGLSEDAAEALAKEYGLTEESVNALKRSMDKVPKKVESKIEAETDKAMRRLQEIRRYLSGNWDKTVRVSTIYQEFGSTAARSLLNDRKLTANGVPNYAVGGAVLGPGTGTSDSIDARLSGNWDKTVRVTTVYQEFGSQAARTFLNDRRMTENGVPNYAVGGAVFGPGTGTSDSIDARLSNGEHVWTAAEVSKLGGQAAMYALRNAVRAGWRPGFADGGAVQVRGPVQSGMSSADVSRLAALLSGGRGIQLQVNAGAASDPRSLMRAAAWELGR